MRSGRTSPLRRNPRGFNVCHALLHSRAACSSRPWRRYGKFLGHDLNPGAVASLKAEADKINVLATDLNAASTRRRPRQTTTSASCEALKAPRFSWRRHLN